MPPAFSLKTFTQTIFSLGKTPWPQQTSKTGVSTFSPQRPIFSNKVSITPTTSGGGNVSVASFLHRSFPASPFLLRRPQASVFFNSSCGTNMTKKGLSFDMRPVSPSKLPLSFSILPPTPCQLKPQPTSWPDRTLGLPLSSTLSAEQTLGCRRQKKYSVTFGKVCLLTLQ